MNIHNTLISLVIGAFSGAFLTFMIMDLSKGEIDVNELRAEFYAEEAATHVSPHSIRERMDKGDDSFILVDIRAVEDYEREHIIGAINIDTSRALAETLEDFKALPADKEIIIYCYSTACMNGRKAGNFLAENGVYVKEMTVGWNEWRYAWEMWNYDTEWDDHKVEDYVVSGSEPGIPTVKEEHEEACPVGGSLGC